MDWVKIYTIIFFLFFATINGGEIQKMHTESEENKKKTEEYKSEGQGFVFVYTFTIIPLLGRIFGWW